MENILVFMALIMWMIVTLLLAISIVGLIVICTDKWMYLGSYLIEKLKV
jgi:hypothetical protein